MVDPLNRERGRHLLEKVATAFAHEIAGASGEAVIRSHLWPTASSLIDHLGRNYLWAAEIVRSGGPVARNTLPRAPADGLREWFEDCRDELLAALAAGPDTPCWTLFDREGTAGFWSRRMTFETVKHLIDIRAADGGVMVPAAELAAVDYADGIDELFEVFLARSRATLPRLPRPLALEAIDLDRRWRFDENWNVTTDEGAVGTVVIATAGDLALLVWERADPFARAAPLRIDGPPDAVEAFAAAPIHP